MAAVAELGSLGGVMELNRVVEIHDSILAGVEAVGRDAVVRLAPAYVHQSAGQPGIDPGSGWLQDIDLVIREAVVESSPSRSPCSLSDGTLSIGEMIWENCVPFPLTSSNSVLLSATTENCEVLIIRGVGAEAVPRGEPRYLDQFPGTPAR